MIRGGADWGLAASAQQAVRKPAPEQAPEQASPPLAQMFSREKIARAQRRRKDREGTGFGMINS